MSAISFAKAGARVFGRDKPHSSITNLVDILTSREYELEAYDGIPELADSINLQASGPTEASRALRKKLKHGNSHQQYRSMVILKALVDNSGHNFQTTFADGQLTEALKYLASGNSADPQVRRKVLAVLASWHTQFKDDASMKTVAGLFKECRAVERSLAETTQNLSAMGIYDTSEADKKKAEREEARKAKKEVERKRKEREAERKRPPFVFAKEKPQILNAIATASQASNNLVNAIMLVNEDKDDLRTNTRVQECLATARDTRKSILRYIQLVENEEIIGTLIEANERIVSALIMYNRRSAPDYKHEDDSGLAHTPPDETGEPPANRGPYETSQTEEGKSQKPLIHPDLEELGDLSFGPLGDERRNLPPPLRPSAARANSSGAESDQWNSRGSLSDLSDYESSDEETHNASPGPSKKKSGRRSYVHVSDDPDEGTQDETRHVRVQGKHDNVDDPFSDPIG